jgi:glycogen phosphorylase
VAFCCAEFGVHASLPIYSGGLGVLAGDILKEASDLALPMVGRRPALPHRLLPPAHRHLRLQHEYWVGVRPDRLPACRSPAPTGRPVTVTVPVGDEDVVAQVWRVDVGRVPLYLLDTDRPENSVVGRWVTVAPLRGQPRIRLAQYAVLGVGGVRALAALGIDPSRVPPERGPPGAGAFELLAACGPRSRPGLGRRVAAVRERIVFTTHTPVPAGNETYGRDEVLRVLGRLADATGDRERFLRGLGRIDPATTPSRRA